MADKITEYPIKKQPGKAYFVGKDGFVYETDKGNPGRPKKQEVIEQKPIAENTDSAKPQE